MEEALGFLIAPKRLFPTIDTGPGNPYSVPYALKTLRSRFSLLLYVGIY